jgi:hypothetical protein
MVGEQEWRHSFFQRALLHALRADDSWSRRASPKCGVGLLSRMKKELSRAKSYLIIVIFFVSTLITPAYSQTSARDRRLITYARGLDVSRLDRTLPHRRFEPWFRSLVGTKARITWEINDCGEQSGNPMDGSSINPPLCAQVQGSLPDSREVSVLILVGTHKAGRTGKPIIWSMSLVDKGAVKYPAKLREIRALLQGT